MVERSGEARDAVQQLLVLVKRDEDGALAPQEIDVAAETGGTVFGNEIEIVAERLELVGGHLPDIALGGEDGRAHGIESAKGMQQRWVLRGLFEPVEIVRIFAKIDEVAGRLVRISPGNDEDRIISATFDGPFTEHLSILSA